MKNRLWAYLIFFCLAFGFISFLTQGIPLNSAELWIHKLNTLDKNLDEFFRIGMYKFDIETRPFSYLRYQALISLVGFNSSVFHLTENIPFAALIVLIFYLTYKYTDSFLAGLWAGLFYMINPITYFACGPNTLNLDLLVQLFLLLTAAIFLGLYLHPQRYRNTAFFWQMLMLLLLFLAVKTKAPARLMPFVILFFILIDNWRRVKEFAVFLTWAIIMVLPFQQILRYLGVPVNIQVVYNYFDEPGKIIRFLFFTKEYPSHFGPTLLGVIGWPIAVLFLICLAFNLKNKKALEVTYRNIRDGQKKYEETKKFILFLAVFFFCCAIGMCITPYTRSPYYLNGILVPTVILIGVIFYQSFLLAKQRKKHALIGWIIFFAVFTTLGVNSLKVMILRGGHVSYFIAQENIGKYFEKNIRNALILGEVELLTQSRLNLNNTEKWAPPEYSREQLKKIVGHPLDSGNIYMMMENYLNIDELITEDLERLKKEYRGYKIYLVKRGELRIDPAIKTEFVAVVYPRTDTLYDYLKDKLPFIKVHSRHVYNIYKVTE